MHQLIWLLALTLTTLWSGGVRAESVRVGDYDIYYTTFSSMIIPPDVAKAHDIIRGESRMMTNITIRKDDKAVPAIVAGHSRNLLSQLLPLEFKEVVEPLAIYYLASQIVDERDTLFYTIDIRASGMDEPYHLEFTRDYHFGRSQ